MLYNIDARSTLRSFLRKLNRTGQFVTANGKANLYAGRTQVALQLRTASSKKPILLKYQIIRAAIQLMYYSRTVTRADLEVFTKGPIVLCSVSS
jgi:hypothetical protein